ICSGTFICLVEIIFEFVLHFTSLWKKSIHPFLRVGFKTVNLEFKSELELFGRLYQIPLFRIYRKHDRSLQVYILSYDLK
ncbi:hypothetical protein L9F63_001718, partial [Diploptera punctata]